MTTEEFQDSVERLTDQIIDTIEAFFTEHQFDKSAMSELSGQDVAQLAADAHMFGADIYVTA